MLRPSAIVAVLAVLMTLAPLSWAASSASASASPIEATSVQKKSAASRYQRAARNATNARRADHNRRALKKQKCVQRYAVKQAKAMAKAQSMYHQDLGPIMTACKLRGVGENVAYGYTSGRSVVNQGWMRSSGHRANILNKGFRLMGIGARKGANGRWYVAQVFGTRR